MMRYALAVAGTMLLVVSSSPSSEELPPLGPGSMAPLPPMRFQAFPAATRVSTSILATKSPGACTQDHHRCRAVLRPYSGTAGRNLRLSYRSDHGDQGARRSMLFTEGYLNTDFQFLIKKGAPKVTKLADLKGKTISVNKGSVYDLWARELERKIGWKVNRSARRPTPCRPCWPAGPMPTLPAIPSLHGR